MNFTIIKEPQPHKQKTLIYGLPGVGKSTLASTMDQPLFIDIEGGVTNLSVARTQTIGLYQNIIKVLLEIHANKDECTKEYHTLVIDSIDWLCRKAEEHASGVRTVVEKKVVVDMSATIGKANGGYGNGGKQLENHIRAELLPLLDVLVADGFAICLIAHADAKDLMDGEGVRTTKISPAVHERLMEPIVQWCDNVFYLKNVAGERELLLEGTETVLAKNRLGKVGSVKLADTTIQEVLTPKKEVVTGEHQDEN